MRVVGRLLWSALDGLIASFGILRGLRRLSGRPKTVIKFFKVIAVNVVLGLLGLLALRFPRFPTELVDAMGSTVGLSPNPSSSTHWLAAASASLARAGWQLGWLLPFFLLASVLSVVLAGDIIREVLAPPPRAPHVQPMPASVLEASSSSTSSSSTGSSTAPSVRGKSSSSSSTIPPSSSSGPASSSSSSAASSLASLASLASRSFAAAGGPGPDGEGDGEEVDDDDDHDDTPPVLKVVRTISESMVRILVTLLVIVETTVLDVLASVIASFDVDESVHDDLPATSMLSSSSSSSLSPSNWIAVAQALAATLVTRRTLVRTLWWIVRLSAIGLLAIVYAFACFDARWVRRGEPLERRFARVERHWAFFLGFGVVLAAVSYAGNAFTGTALYDVGYPVLALVALSTEEGRWELAFPTPGPSGKNGDVRPSDDTIGPRVSGESSDGMAGLAGLAAAMRSLGSLAGDSRDGGVDGSMSRAAEGASGAGSTLATPSSLCSPTPRPTETATMTTTSSHASSSQPPRLPVFVLHGPVVSRILRWLFGLVDQAGGVGGADKAAGPSTTGTTTTTKTTSTTNDGRPRATPSPSSSTTSSSWASSLWSVVSSATSSVVSAVAARVNAPTAIATPSMDAAVPSASRATTAASSSSSSSYSVSASAAASKTSTASASTAPAGVHSHQKSVRERERERERERGNDLGDDRHRHERSHERERERDRERGRVREASQERAQTRSERSEVRSRHVGGRRDRASYGFEEDEEDDDDERRRRNDAYEVEEEEDLMFRMHNLHGRTAGRSGGARSIASSGVRLRPATSSLATGAVMRHVQPATRPPASAAAVASTNVTFVPAGRVRGSTDAAQATVHDPGRERERRAGRG